MQIRLSTIIALATLGLGTMALSEPAAARQPGSLAYMSAKQLQRACKAEGGTFGKGTPHYYCILGSNAIMCDASARQCAMTAIAETTSGDDSAGPDYPPPSLSDGLLAPDLPLAAPPPAPAPIIGPVERGHGRRIPH